MGADMLIARLVLDQERKPDWAAGQAAIMNLDYDYMVSILADNGISEDLDDARYVPGTNDPTVTACRELIAKIFEDLKECFERGREIDAFNVRGATVYVAGGMSWGDDPTEAFRTFCLAGCFPEVCAAIGFDFGEKEQ